MDKLDQYDDADVAGHREGSSLVNTARAMASGHALAGDGSGTGLRIASTAPRP
jgi:hypothetical protein